MYPSKYISPYAREGNASFLPEILSSARSLESVKETNENDVEIEKIRALTALELARMNCQHSLDMARVNESISRMEKATQAFIADVNSADPSKKGVQIEDITPGLLFSKKKICRITKL